MYDSVKRQYTLEPTVAARVRKTPKTYRLTPAKIAAAKAILGAATATEAIETALDLVVFRQELMDGVEAMRGVVITPPDGDAS